MFPSRTRAEASFCPDEQQYADDGEDMQEMVEAELEMIQAAYTSEEVLIQRNARLAVLRVFPLFFTLRLYLPEGYPEKTPLEIGVTDIGNNKLLHSSVPKLVPTWQAQAKDMLGTPAVLSMFQLVEAWVQDMQKCIQITDREICSPLAQIERNSSSTRVSRVLLYSHHIISKIKRGNIAALSKEYNLTGLMKIGWPGLIIVEGTNDAPYKFYDEIKGWNWKYLVIRGEMEDDGRVFKEFRETEDLSEVAQSCRDGCIEELYLSFMKGKIKESDTSVDDDSAPYGLLIHVDHMNNGRSYRKWLRKTAASKECSILIKKWGGFVVAVVAESQIQTQQFMKAWRTSKVDVDGKGKPCLERHMAVVAEGEVNLTAYNMNWDSLSSEQELEETSDLRSIFAKIGGQNWVSFLSM